MTMRTVELGDCRFEVRERDGAFLGLGRVWIGDTPVRSGRLPLTVYTQTFATGAELGKLTLLGIDEGRNEVRLRLKAEFRPLPVKLMRDHSFDPIHELSDWDDCAPAGAGELDLVLQTARDSFNGVEFAGFSYHYEYRSKDTPIFYLLDKASWELDGDIEGATAYSQSACTAPTAHFEADTAWSTEGVLFFLVESGNENPIMTHNLPRWASHGSFDFQFKGDKTLLGVFERVDLIRSIVTREAGKAELKHFDKHIFDQALEFSTAAKKILLRVGNDVSEAEQQNLWTWAHCEVEDRARAEYGLLEEPFYPRVSWNFWNNFTIDSYYRDLLPAAISIGCKQLFLDNLNRSAMTDGSIGGGNMCCGHEYEIAPRLGGDVKMKALVERCREHGIQPMCWTNNDQAYSSPLNSQERDEKSWYVKMEDARLKYGGAYTNVFTILDFSQEGPRRYWIEALKKIRDNTGLNGYLFDSFYNLGFMPVSYSHMQPRTMWRQLLDAFKELQDADIHFLIESFGPFGMPQHGHPSSYNPGCVFICYRVGMGNDYTTVPTGHPLKEVGEDDVAAIYYGLAHMAGCDMSLFKDEKRIDERWGAEHRQALADYHAVMNDMKVRYLQEDGQGVLWHDAKGKQATLYNFAAREVSLPGHVHDLTSGQDLPSAATYRLHPSHTYAITGCSLPVTV